MLFNGGIPDMVTWDMNGPGSPQLVTGQNVLAIQVHNANATSSDLTARPFLGLRKAWGAQPSTAHPRRGGRKLKTTTCKRRFN